MNHEHRSTFPAWLALLIAIGSGALIAVQARINGQLGARLDDGFLAAAISFGGGLVVLLVALGVSKVGRTGIRTVVHAVRAHELPWWSVLGGTAGAFLVLSQGLTAAALGVALFTVAVVAGQTTSGLLLDRVGFGPGGRVYLTAPRVIGAAIALVAVGLAVSGEFGGDIPLWMLVLPLIAGLGVSWQQAVNGRVRVRAQSTLAATAINFVVGTIALGIAAVVHIAIVGPPDAFPTEPWLYLGGPIGCVFIAVAAYLVEHTGVLILGLGTVAGQTLSALALDLFLPGDGGGVHTTTIIGTMLAFVAVAIASIRRRKGPAAAS
ncbi:MULTISPECIES: DMT family transporter [unclassified Plantibacter]|jgi:transporter family-2 protein|uniref:DMT family transporter n=1 Tax=unclassified Plantibacter TaxID=2624265 RepID=UPI003D3477A9